MSWGLSVYSDSGVAVIDQNTRIARSVSTHSYSLAASGTVTISVSGMANNGTWLALDPRSQVKITIQSGSFRLDGPTYATSGTIHVMRY